MMHMLACHAVPLPWLPAGAAIMCREGVRWLAGRITPDEEGFESPSIRTRADAKDRYALAELRAAGEPCAHTVRTVLDAGLTALGWPLERRILEYAKYSAECVSTGTTNRFEG
jgi:hypothetical protein